MTELLPKSPSNGGVASLSKTTQNGFVDFQLVSTELYRSEYGSELLLVLATNNGEEFFYL